MNGDHNKLNKFGKIFLLVVLILFSGYTSFSQIELKTNDTIKIKGKKAEYSGRTENQSTKVNNDDQTNNSNSDAPSQVVKHIKASRPDMSKARNARPTNIVRPTGSRIPNGIGRPAGAIRAGHG